MTTTATRELTLDDVVTRLGKTADYWSREINRKPYRFEHLRVGREIRLTEEQYAALRDHYRVRPELASAEVDPLRSQTARSRARSR